MSFLNTQTTVRRRRANVPFRRSRTAAEGPAGRHLQRRQRNDPVEPGPPIIPPSPPIPPKGTTITQIRTLSTLAGTTRTIPASTRTTPTPTLTSSSSSSTRSTSSTSSSSSISDTPTIIDSITRTPTAVPLPTASETSTAGSDASNNPGTAIGQRGGLSSGAIAGIAITVVVVLAALIAFLVRRRMIASRTTRRDDWAGRGGLSAVAAPPPPPQMQQQGWNQTVEYGGDAPSAMTAAPFGTTYRPDSLIPGRGQSTMPVPYQPNAAPIDVPVNAVTPATAQMLSSVAPTTGKSSMVRCTFVPSMQDELSIVTGEMITILQEYDDGWALCQNASGQQGMVPLECLYDMDEDERNSKRTSSLRS